MLGFGVNHKSARHFELIRELGLLGLDLLVFRLDGILASSPLHKT